MLRKMWKFAWNGSWLVNHVIYYPIKKIFKEFIQIIRLGCGKKANHLLIKRENIKKILKDRIIKIYI